MIPRRWPRQEKPPTFGENWQTPETTAAVKTWMDSHMGVKFDAPTRRALVQGGVTSDAELKRLLDTGHFRMSPGMGAARIAKLRSLVGAESRLPTGTREVLADVLVFFAKVFGKADLSTKLRDEDLTALADSIRKYGQVDDTKIYTHKFKQELVPIISKAIKESM